jgi:hypothetical protein
MPPPIEPTLPDLAKFLRSFLIEKQIAEFVALLSQGNVTVLDPETVQQNGIPDKPVMPQGIEEILKEMETAYSVERFSPLTPDESRRVRDAFPNFIERCSAYQGRHLVKMLREKLKPQ